MVSSSLPVGVISDAGKKRIKGHHPWIFSNELEQRPSDITSGDILEIHDRSGRYVATGYYNPQTLIAVRILSFHKSFDLRSRIHEAYEIRKKDFHDKVYRLIFSESDRLPGLIVDRYNETLVIQILTAGMERMRQPVLAALQELLQPQRILLRNDSAYRKLEGLPQEVEWYHGTPVEDEVIEMDGLKICVQYEKGQKTGFFLDQRQNRKRLLEAGAAHSLLDLFAYTGSWSVYGAAAGIEQVVAVDTSEEALDVARRNAAFNGFSITTRVSDVPEYLRIAVGESVRYDRIVLDPPAFCKSKRHLSGAIRAYREINLRAMKLLNSGGLLFTCSCSQPVKPELFLEILKQAATASGREFRLRELLFQPPDHPILLNFPESHYLKCAILEVQ